tara:strand:+ start:612 stop:782 length:171 start_codon:yes stop_codon:yes gene_type:complete
MGHKQITKDNKMTNEEKKTYREHVKFYKTHRWVKKENGRWVLIYFPISKIERGEDE